MAQIDVRRLYADGDILLGSDLDAFLDDVETFLNITKINDDNIQDNSITASSKLADATVTAAKLASNSVTTAKINDLAVTTAKINDLAVTTAKVDALAITAAKLAADAVETAKIKDLNVTAGKLAADAVETAKIKDANVTTAKIADANVTSDKIATLDARKLTYTDTSVSFTSAGLAFSYTLTTDYPTLTIFLNSDTIVNGFFRVSGGLSSQSFTGTMGRGTVLMQWVPPATAGTSYNFYIDCSGGFTNWLGATNATLIVRES
jgi:hypothetical protein